MAAAWPRISGCGRRPSGIVRFESGGPIRHAHLVVFAAALGGCAGAGPAGDAAPTYFEDVKPILDGRCVGCHTDGGIGGFALDSYEAARIADTAVHGSVEDGSMPPWLASDEVDYAYDWTLTGAQVATIGEWVEAGAPEGNAEHEGEPLAYAGSALSRVDLTVEMRSPYTPNPALSDDYRCFPIPWPGDATEFITGFNALPGNGSVVHHVAVFLIDADNLIGESVFEQLQQWDADEPDPGYTCFGGPSGPTGALDLPIQQIAQWVPGSQGLDFPAGTGIKVDPGAWMVLQIHYNTVSPTDDTTDQTAVEFRLDDTVERTAAFAPWLSASWVLGNMEVPAGDTATFTADGDPQAFFELLNPNLDLDGGFTIHSAMLHMHGLGQSGEVHVVRSDGSTVGLLDVPDWDFDWQLSYQLADPVEVQPGDQLSLSCTFDNDTAEAVSWGEGSSQEMCVANLFISHE